MLHKANNYLHATAYWRIASRRKYRCTALNAFETYVKLYINKIYVQ